MTRTCTWYATSTVSLLCTTASKSCTTTVLNTSERRARTTQAGVALLLNRSEPATGPPPLAHPWVRGTASVAAFRPIRRRWLPRCERLRALRHRLPMPCRQHCRCCACQALPCVVELGSSVCQVFRCLCAGGHGAAAACACPLCLPPTGANTTARRKISRAGLRPTSTASHIMQSSAGLLTHVGCLPSPPLFLLPKDLRLIVGRRRIRANFERARSELDVVLHKLDTYTPLTHIHLLFWDNNLPPDGKASLFDLGSWCSAQASSSELRNSGSLVNDSSAGHKGPARGALASRCLLPDASEVTHCVSANPERATTGRKRRSKQRIGTARATASGQSGGERVSGLRVPRENQQGKLLAFRG